MRPGQAGQARSVKAKDAGRKEKELSLSVSRCGSFKIKGSGITQLVQWFALHAKAHGFPAQDYIKYDMVAHLCKAKIWEVDARR